MKDEAATLPRITEIVIIARRSPWCTIVRKEIGVTLEDVCAALWRESVFSSSLVVPHPLAFHSFIAKITLTNWHSYTEHALTETEIGTLSPHERDKVKRLALARESGAIGGGTMSAMWGSTAAIPVNRCKRIGQCQALPSQDCGLFCELVAVLLTVSLRSRVDWLRGRTTFDGLEIDEAYVKKRLGFSAANVFVLDVTN